MVIEIYSFLFFVCFGIAIFDLMHDVEALFYLPKLLLALQLHGHHSYFRRDFQMLVAVSISHV